MYNKIFIPLISLLFVFVIFNCVKAEGVDEVEKVFTTNNYYSETKSFEKEDIYLLILNNNKDLSDKMLGYTERSLDHAKNTVNYFLCILSVVTAVCIFFGWRTLNGMKSGSKKIAQEIAEKEVSKVISKLEEKVNNIDEKFQEGKDIELLERQIQNNETPLLKKLEIINKIIVKKPKDYLWRGSKGIILMKMFKHQEAIKSFNEAIELNSKDDIAYSNRGHCLSFLKKYQEAVESFDEAIELNNENDRAYNSKANALLELGLFQASIKSFDRAIELNPSNCDYKNNKACALLKERKYEEAIDLLEELKAMKLKSDEDFDSCYFFVNISYAYHKLRDFGRAYNTARSGLNVKPSLELIVNKGLAAAGLDKRDEAIDLLKTAREIASGDKENEVIYCQAKMYSLIKDSDNAIKHLKLAIEKNNKWKEDAKNDKDFDFISGSNDFKLIVS